MSERNSSETQKKARHHFPRSRSNCWFLCGWEPELDINSRTDADNFFVWILNHSQIFKDTSCSSLKWPVCLPTFSAFKNVDNFKTAVLAVAE